MKHPFPFALFVVATIFYAPAALVAGPSAGEGQADIVDAPPAPAEVANILANKLGLSLEQKEQILPILSTRQQKLKDLRDNASLRPLQRARMAKDVLDESDRQLNAILTPDQRKQYVEIEKEMMNRVHRSMQQRTGGGSL